MKIDERLLTERDKRCANADYEGAELMRDAALHIRKCHQLIDWVRSEADFRTTTVANIFYRRANELRAEWDGEA